MRRVAVLSIGFVALACHDDITATPDGGAAVSDAAMSDAAMSDAAMSDAAMNDAGELTDLGIDDTLHGTTLEGIALEWPDTLELCGAWVENLDVAEALAERAHLTLPPQRRASLGRNDLSLARLESGRVRHGPFADQQWAIADAQAAPAITDYTLTETSVSTTLVWELGAAGVLSEQLSVTRARGDTHPVTYGREDYETSFSLQRPGAMHETYLEPCGGPARRMSVLEVLAATNGTGIGARSVNVLRELRTEPAPDGSYPVNLVSTTLRFSDAQGEAVRAFGYWSQTYVAQHHNWNESTLVDFTEDPITYDQIYEPYTRGQPGGLTQMIALLEMHDVNPVSMSMTPSIDISTLDFASGQTSVETWQSGRWARVDSESLRPSITAVCAGGDVYSFRDYSYQYAFQMLACPRPDPPGWELKTIVPVVFPADAPQTGARISGAAIAPISVGGRTGFAATIGTARVEISRMGTQGIFTLEIYDAANTLISSSNVAPEPLIEELYADAPLDASSADDTVHVSFVRRARQAVASISVRYTPVRATFTFGGATHDVEAWDRMDYASTHHNWSDHLEAEGDGLRMSWRTMYTPNGLEDYVRAERVSDGVEVLPETQVIQGR